MVEICSGAIPCARIASITARCFAALSALALAAVAARVCTPIEIVARSGTYRASPVALVLISDGGRRAPGLVAVGCCAASDNVAEVMARGAMSASTCLMMISVKGRDRIMQFAAALGTAGNAD